MKRLILGALLASIPFFAQAWCGGFEEPIDDHYAYWTNGAQVWQNSYGECWITGNDLSYHHDQDQAVSCGDAAGRVAAFTVAVHANFDFDEYGLRAVDAVQINEAVESIESVGGVVTRVLIAGHTDSYGPYGYNIDLGLNRARTVALFLDSLLPVSPEIEITSLGEFSPIDTNLTPEGRFENRRAEAVLEFDVIVYGSAR